MKLALGLGLVCCAGLALSAAAQAQGLPQGPYLDTCDGAQSEGPNLMAQCRDAAGVEHRSALINYPRCVGPITNNNGVLTCDFGLAGPVPLVTPARPPVTEVAIRCDDLHRESADLQAQRDATFDPIERAHIEGRLHEVQDEEDDCTQ
jgi:hypothetical protein